MLMVQLQIGQVWINSISSEPFFFLKTLAFSLKYSWLFQSSNEIDVIMLFESVFCGFGAFILIFLVSEVFNSHTFIICPCLCISWFSIFWCKMGERFSGAYDGLIDELNENDWYLLPSEMTRMFIILMINAQKPLDVKFFGSFSLGRYQFSQVRQGFHLHWARKLAAKIVSLSIFIAISSMN